MSTAVTATMSNTTKGSMENYYASKIGEMSEVSCSFILFFFAFCAVIFESVLNVLFIYVIDCPRAPGRFTEIESTPK